MSVKMQSTRNREYMKVSPTVKLRNQHRAADAEVGDHGPYPVSRCQAVSDRSPSPRGRTSYSPNTLHVSRRAVLVSDGRNKSMERRDLHVWHLGGGSSEKLRSRSPPYEQLRKRPRYDDVGVVNRKCDYVELCGFDDIRNSRVRSVYRHDHGTSRTGTSKEKDYFENRITSIDEHVTVGWKLIPAEDFAIRRSHRLPQYLDPSLNYAETSGKSPLSSRGIDIDQYEHEMLWRWERMPSNKLMDMDSYEEDKPIFRSRNAAYDMVAASHAKELIGTSQLKDLASTSYGIPRSELLSSYQDHAPLPVSEEYPWGSGKIMEPAGYNQYNQRQLIDSARDPVAIRRNMTLYELGANSPSQAECGEFLYRKHRTISGNNHGYATNDRERMTPPRSRIGYEHAPIDYVHREMPKSNILHRVVDRIDNSDDSRGNPRCIIWDDHTLEYIDMSGSYASTQSGEYLGSDAHVEFRRRLPQEYEMLHMNALPDYDRQVSILRSDYGLGREAGPVFQKERLKDSPANFEAEQSRLGLRAQRIEDELEMYSERIHKRKYLMEEDVSRPSSKTIASSKLHSPGDFGSLYDSKQQIDENIIHLHETIGYGNNEYRKVGREYDGEDNHGDVALEDWYTSEGSLAHAQRTPIRFYKKSGKYIRGHAGVGSFTWHTSHHNDRRSKFWEGYDDYDEDVNANDDDMTEDLVNHSEAELSEDSEEFKQLVHEAFLKYSKKLNSNHSVRKRYLEQGNAGSLFCIVCGRSNSKEFMETQSLVMHAFMSHKFGLRAEHLGLHKAICVLLGWDSIAPPDTINWLPRILPEAEVLAQKEDLVPWPPIVVILNISMVNNNPGEQKVVPIEEVQAFLRGKGFIDGEISVCLGRPADQSVMVVKFLGTLTGLSMAERLHQYFVENKRGRDDIQRITSNNDRSSIKDLLLQGEKLEERLLYGYMAIAEDLDKLDFDNRKCSLIKSKKEIQNLGDDFKIDERKYSLVRKAANNKRIDLLISWKCPPDGVVKINVDAAARGNPGDRALGGLGRDAEGNWIFGFIRRLGWGHIIEAELFAIFYGLCSAWERGYRQVIIESDSLHAVNKVNGDLYPDRLHQVVHDCQDLLKRDWQCCVVHTYREANMCADCLATLAYQGGFKITQLENPPERLQLLLQDDMIGVTRPRAITVN